MRVLRFRDMSGEATFDLNLAPMMDMFVSIIPFMLLSATFLQLSLINVPLPTPVAQALANDRKQDIRDVSIKIVMRGTKDLVLEIKDDHGKANAISISKVQNDYNFKALHVKLVEIKQKFPKV